jgi:hypothetical protein
MMRKNKRALKECGKQDLKKADDALEPFAHGGVETR